jgi:lipopolysaccharide transport system permease protein
MSADQAPAVLKATTLIRPSNGWVGIDVRELWSYRELAFFFVWRDLKVRYKQTIFGVLWAVLQPLGLVIVFSLFLGRVSGIGQSGVPSNLQLLVDRYYFGKP